VQTLLFLRSPRHVVVQFIMREKTRTVASRMKYALMTWCFSSVYLCVCSSRSEAEYYVKVFGWRPDKVGYQPLHTDSSFLRRHSAEEERMVLSAGRTFRDYPTLLQAFASTDVSLTIVASPANLAGAMVPANVTVTYDVPIDELVGLMARSMVVVLPLEDRQISIGQSVLIEAMTMGKPVVVTRVNGTIDYIEHLKTGMLVPPRDPAAIRDAVELLMADADLRHRIGAAAHAQVMSTHLPRHYASGVANLLRNR
jgi:glycosyltransferase involved in cell wall biosynthesis